MITITIRQRLRALWAALEVIPWTCESCCRGNETPRLFWDTVKPTLICRHCRYMQNYPNWIKPIDPYPPSR